TYGGNGSTCPPTGACIATNGVCTIRYQANCTFVNGTYQGNNSMCPAQGACIAANGDCTQVNSFQCAFQQGMFQGPSSACPATGGLHQPLPRPQRDGAEQRDLPVLG